jgi:hypothetical protein
MGILLAFAPFGMFAAVNTLIGGTAALVAGTVASAALLIRDLMIVRRTPRVLEIGTTILFGGLALYAVIADPGWSVFSVRLRVDIGLLLIVVVSLAIRRPFTLQYTREHVPPERWGNPVFIRANYVITSVWALAFGVLVGADLAIVYVPGLPPAFGVAATVLALVVAVKFPGWYRERMQAKAAGSGVARATD